MSFKFESKDEGRDITLNFPVILQNFDAIIFSV
jgi:hypothetical protein